MTPFGNGLPDLTSIVQCPLWSPSPRAARAAARRRRRHASHTRRERTRPCALGGTPKSMGTALPPS